jgi:hypothetical protein
MPVHLTVEHRQLALRLRARGLSLREIGPQVGCSHELVRIIVRQAPRRPVRRSPQLQPVIRWRGAELVGGQAMSGTGRTAMVVLLPPRVDRGVS